MLEADVKGQVNRFILLHFHQAVYKDLDEEEARERYIADFTLPKDASQPKKYQNRFDITQIVDPRISLRRQYVLAIGIKKLGLDSAAEKWTTSQIAEWINTDDIKNLTKYPPKRPYLVFTHDGLKYHSYPEEKALALFDDDEVGSPLMEVTALFLNHPEYFIGRGIDAAGSRYRGNRTPDLNTFGGRPGVDARWYDYRGPDWGVLSRGKKVILLGNAVQSAQ